MLKDFPLANAGNRTTQELLDSIEIAKETFEDDPRILDKWLKRYLQVLSQRLYNDLGGDEG